MSPPFCSEAFLSPHSYLPTGTTERTNERKKDSYVRSPSLRPTDAATKKQPTKKKKKETCSPTHPPIHLPVEFAGLLPSAQTTPFTTITLDARPPSAANLTPPLCDRSFLLSHSPTNSPVVGRFLRLLTQSPNHSSAYLLFPLLLSSSPE
mmetsp:Transcript_24549/g.79364  ORF Transcript_24549/g.79364 Transcript_24549/m.79364 type:complete len:150 (-) Transcript_24549:155-604(-)